MSRVGYSRVSTTDQSTEVQEAQLLEAGCDKVFSEKASGTSRARPVLEQTMDYLREGDVLVVTRLDRLARSQTDLYQLLSELQDKGVGFECTEQAQVNTTGPMGKLLLGILGAVAEFENGLRRERQAEGIAKAKAEGKYKGGPSLKAETVSQLQDLLQSGVSISQAARQLGVSRTTVHKYKGA